MTLRVAPRRRLAVRPLILLASAGALLANAAGASAQTWSGGGLFVCPSGAIVRAAASARPGSILARWEERSSSAGSDTILKQAALIPYYGKNNIHYDRFAWEIYTTDHFEIYYYPGIKKHLERVAGYAESAYQQVSADLKHDLSFKIGRASCRERV